MPLKITDDILNMLATKVAQSAIDLEDQPTLTWVYEKVNKDYGDQLTDDEKNRLIKIMF